MKVNYENYFRNNCWNLLVLSVLTAIAPKEFKLESEIKVNKPKAEVFGYLKFLKNHEQWNAWSKKDPAMKKEFKGTDGMVGFISSWESNHEEVGTAEQEILNIVEGLRLDTEIRFKTIRRSLQFLCYN